MNYYKPEPRSETEDKFHGYPNGALVNTNKNQIAIFDGIALTTYDNSKRTGYWGAMSGKPDYQGKENQGLKNKGPLPEGTYVARQSKLQHRNDYSTIKKQTSWKGGSAAWGNHRI